MNPLAEKLRHLREQRKLTQQALAKQSGVGLRTIAGIERDETVTKETLFKILAPLNLSENERLDCIIAWIRSELGEAANKIYIRKAEGLKGNEQLLRLFHSLSDADKKEFLKAMEHKGIIIDGLRILNRTWEGLNKQAQAFGKKSKR